MWLTQMIQSMLRPLPLPNHEVVLLTNQSLPEVQGEDVVIHIVVVVGVVLQVLVVDVVGVVLELLIGVHELQPDYDQHLQEDPYHDDYVDDHKLSLHLWQALVGQESHFVIEKWKWRQHTLDHLDQPHQGLE